MSEYDTHPVSLDHTVWLHRPVRVDRWLLPEFYPVATGAGRGLALGSVSWSVCGRSSPGDDGPLLRFLAAGTRSVVADKERVEALARQARVVIDDGPPGRLLRLRDAYPHLVLTTITPFGADGPWAQRPATEFTLQGWCGSILSRGTPDRPPLQAGGRIGEWASGISAAVETMAALREARRRKHSRAKGPDVPIVIIERHFVRSTTESLGSVL
jgi:hypothetical protein